MTDKKLFNDKTFEYESRALLIFKAAGSKKLNRRLFIYVEIIYNL